MSYAVAGFTDPEHCDWQTADRAILLWFGDVRSFEGKLVSAEKEKIKRKMDAGIKYVPISLLLFRIF